MKTKALKGTMQAQYSLKNLNSKMWVRIFHITTIFAIVEKNSFCTFKNELNLCNFTINSSWNFFKEIYFHLKNYYWSISSSLDGVKSLLIITEIKDQEKESEQDMVQEKESE